MRKKSAIHSPLGKNARPLSVLENQIPDKSAWRTKRKHAPSARLRDLVEEERDKLSSRDNLTYCHESLLPADIALHLFDEDKETCQLFDEFGLDEHQCYHWRALLNALSRFYVENRGRKEKHRPYGLLELALDLDDIRRKHFHGRKYKVAEAARLLQQEPCYRNQYGTENKRTFRDRVAWIVKSIEPMDNEARDRAFDLYGKSPSDERFNWPDEDAEF